MALKTVVMDQVLILSSLLEKKKRKINGASLEVLWLLLLLLTLLF